MNTGRPSKRESLRRILALQMDLVGLLLQTALYAWIWFDSYYPLVRLKLKFYVKGHILILLIYFFLLLFLTRTYEGNKIGYLKPFDVILSQIFSLAAVDVISYFQISLMRNWVVPQVPMWKLLALQCVLAVLWVNISDFVYKRVFPPRDMLLVYGERPIEDIMAKFAGRPDKYRITACMNISEGIEAVEKKAEAFGTVVLWDIPTMDRNRLMKYCYGHAIRMYVMPKIPDVLMRGSAQIHLSDTPLYMTREYALSFEQRFWKRAIDLVGAVLLLILSSPVFLITALAIYFYDRGPVFYRQTRCTQGMKEFRIIKFRSMRVDAEKDGVARLAAQNDDRITPVGRFIRTCRIDELPQLFNVLRGEMSFIGPRPERPQIIRQYMEEMPEFAFRTRVKAGLAGYAQIYGKYNTTPYDKLKLDLTYIQNYSVGLDLKLMLLTLKILVQPESTEGVGEGQTTAMKNDET
ncbi:exopolysaccharide biosynthesis polyprenyl glycosylphosphotransferase [Lachnoclostridium sp. Marseille-P6806]|uniref:exopolysaccharide biosynthesis polyprenyl glycosylphosphotransferase n=1 Tax=Lachnoclostridium sp. Marseille-P6806 TaxID=2364793 RepID=UPI00103163FB|nr:exopolysaccharide biosynthesis polyprenyl glycosylphosphotransferase [Lachnoclostridium sp. Marseille-P6806]